MKNIAIYASGSGSNALKIMEHFSEHHLAKVALVITNNSAAGVINHAKKFNVPCTILEKKDLKSPQCQLEVLKHHHIELIALAGYLKQIPAELVQAFPERILNIHPALLPKYGGQGMYGLNVHKAVRENNEEFSGPTIHLVDEEYDKGEILFQQKIKLNLTDTPEQIASKVLKSEHDNYATIIEKHLLQL